MTRGVTVFQWYRTERDSFVLVLFFDFETSRAHVIERKDIFDCREHSLERLFSMGRLMRFSVLDELIDHPVNMDGSRHQQEYFKKDVDQEDRGANNIYYRRASMSEDKHQKEIARYEASLRSLHLF